MEDFSIINKHNPKDFLQMHKVLWSLKARGSYANLRNHSMYAGFILVLAIASWYFNTIDNILIFVSLFYLLYLVITYVNILKSKRNYIKRVTAISDRLDQENFEFTYAFNNQSLNYFDKEKTMNFNWSMFANYVEYKGYIILYLTDFEILQYIFEIRNDQESEKIMQFIKSKMNKLEI